MINQESDKVNRDSKIGEPQKLSFMNGNMELSNRQNPENLKTPEKIGDVIPQRVSEF